MTVFNDAQLDYLDKLETNWRNSLPSYTLRELLEIFPDAKPAARRGIKAKIKETKALQTSLTEFRDTWYNTVINKAKFKDQPELIKWLNERIDKYNEQYEHDLKKLHFQLHMVEAKDNEVVASKNGVSDEQIARAKEVPIRSLIKVNGAKKALCVWHTDKNPSMHVYNNHRVYCFACGKAGDSIDVYCALNGSTFIEAVKAMAV